ncbi:MAG: HNH endonuclease [Actinobacteria bacterium]|nr:HNH endonuclease [Actinomycetota bacterium]
METEATAAQLEEEIAEVCGVVNAATGRLVGLIGRVIETEAWQGHGIRSAEQWVAWKCGVSPGRARRLVAMARRLGELPHTRAGLEAGELSEDQVAVVCRHAPACTDAEMAAFARHATVGQLRRTLAGYAFADTPPESPDAPPPEEARRVDFGPTDAGGWRLSAVLAPDEGALVAMADRSLGGRPRPHRDRHLVVVHVGGDGGARLHLGPGLGPGLGRYLGCDARVRAVFEAGGRAASVGRAWRSVPGRTRMVVEDRDRGCRVPGCERTRGLQVHHITHWQDGGPTDTPNLLALCARHHRLHHLGRLGIAGDADDADGVVFTDERGRVLAPSGRPTPPGDLPAAVERLGLPLGTWPTPPANASTPSGSTSTSRRRPEHAQTPRPPTTGSTRAVARRRAADRQGRYRTDQLNRQR